MKVAHFLSQKCWAIRQKHKNKLNASSRLFNFYFIHRDITTLNTWCNSCLTRAWTWPSRTRGGFLQKISRLCREQLDAFPAKWTGQNSEVNWGKAAMSTTILSYILARNRRPTVLMSVTHRAVSLFGINNLDHWEYIYSFWAFYIRLLLFGMGWHGPEWNKRLNTRAEQIYRCLRCYSNILNFMWVCRWPDDGGSSCRRQLSNPIGAYKSINRVMGHYQRPERAVNG